MRAQQAVRGAWSSWTHRLMVGVLALAATSAWGFTQGGGIINSTVMVQASPLGFMPASSWSPHYSDNGGWSSNPAYWRTLGFPDLNGDGKADVCGRGVDGMACALSTGSSFGPAGMWTTGFSDAYGWSSNESHWGTIQFADVDGDGKEDVCGRGTQGVHCELSTGTSFDPRDNLWTPGFADAYGWGTSKSYWGTIRFADVNGDGKADVCGRGPGGIYCELSTGSRFITSSTPWTTGFSDTYGWSSNESHWGTIQFADVNGDGKADVCGRGTQGVHCELSTGTSFDPRDNLWTPGFADAYSWGTSKSYWGTIRFADVNGDGKADVCGRGPGGIYCELSTGSRFITSSTPWTTGFSDAYGWNGSESYWGTIQFADVNADGRADVCGRGTQGVHCELSTGTSFDPRDNLWTTDYSDAQGWGSHASYWKTLKLQDLNGDGKADLCGRASDGLRCALAR
jgi:hypothetical protein